MKRHELLILADCNVKRLENYKAREQLPFSVVGPLNAAKQPSYTVEDAFMLAVMGELIDVAGMRIELARYLAGNVLRKVWWRAAPATGGDVWAALAIEASSDEHAEGRVLVVDTFEMLPARLNEKVSLSDQATVSMINLSRVERGMHARAAKWGLEELIDPALLEAKV